jgi:hypothetical protein
VTGVSGGDRHRLVGALDLASGDHQDESPALEGGHSAGDLAPGIEFTSVVAGAVEG